MSHSKVVLFGINADPPHYGHLKVVLETKKFFGDQALLIIVPAGIHPHNKKQYACFNDRVHMTKLLFQGYSHVVVDDYEGHIKGPSYTLDTLKYIHDKYRASSYYFIIATDVANDFFSWHKPEEILALANPIIISRKGYDCDIQVQEKLKKWSHPIFLNVDIPDISSTAIRTMNLLIPSAEELPESIKTYIQEKKLYS